jgi:hypothetical protein
MRRGPGLRSELVGYAELCQDPSLFGIGHSPSGPVLPDLKVLLMKFCSRAQVLHRGRRHLCFQLEVELIEEVRLGFEVREQRSVGDAGLLRYACRWGAQALRHDEACRGLQNCAPLLVALRPGHKTTI